VREGDAITVHYDPMIAKLIATGETREAARGRAIAALRQFPILGVRTNVPFLIELLEHPRFVAGNLDTRFLDAEGEALRRASVTEPDAAVDAIAAAVRTLEPRNQHRRTSAPANPRTLDPWSALRGVRV
jgi:3-methylcrotonyl-CoA carboxylase alpha subunit